MPELPEVETIRVGLSRLLPGLEIASASFDWPKSFPNAASDVKAFLVGASVIAVARRAKVLLIELSSKYSLVIHLKMTGQLVFLKEGPAPPLGSRANCSFRTLRPELSPHPLKPARSARYSANDGKVRFGAGHPSDSLVGKLPDKSTRVIFEFTNGAKLFFNDQRKFGWVRLMPTAEVVNLDFFKKVGPEPLAAGFTSNVLAERLARRPNTSIKAAILDQTVLAGLGNIYADESLWAAKIHPARLVKSLAASEIKKLHASIREVLELSIASGGSTDRNYIDAEGKKGSYLKFAKVFRREGQPCPRCGTTIEKIRVAARGTHICPHCQKEPK